MTTSTYLIAELSLLIRKHATRGQVLSFLSRKHSLSLEEAEWAIAGAGVEFPERLAADKS